MRYLWKNERGANKMREIKGYLTAIGDLEELIKLSDRGMGMITITMALSLCNKLRKEAHGNRQSKQAIDQKAKGNVKDSLEIA
jgi:hypothetical protein